MLIYKISWSYGNGNSSTNNEKYFKSSDSAETFVKGLREASLLLSGQLKLVVNVDTINVEE